MLAIPVTNIMWTSSVVEEVERTDAEGDAEIFPLRVLVDLELTFEDLALLGLGGWDSESSESAPEALGMLPIIIEESGIEATGILAWPFLMRVGAVDGEPDSSEESSGESAEDERDSALSAGGTDGERLAEGFGATTTAEGDAIGRENEGAIGEGEIEGGADREGEIEDEAVKEGERADGATSEGERGG